MILLGLFLPLLLPARPRLELCAGLAEPPRIAFITGHGPEKLAGLPWRKAAGKEPSWA